MCTYMLYVNLTTFSVHTNSTRFGLLWINLCVMCIVNKSYIINIIEPKKVQLFSPPNWTDFFYHSVPLFLVAPFCLCRTEKKTPLKLKDQSHFFGPESHVCPVKWITGHKSEVMSAVVVVLDLSRWRGKHRENLIRNRQVKCVFCVFQHIQAATKRQQSCE